MISVTNRAPNIRYHTEKTIEGLLVIVIEANLNNPAAYTGDLLDGFLAGAMRAGRSQASDVLAQTIDLISSGIADDEYFRSTITGLVFAGIVVAADHVQVCTAGDIRVHVVDEADRVIHVTRDHNAVTDPQDHLQEERYKHLPGFLEGILTRVLPPRNDGKGDPECWQWELRPEWSVRVCSSRVHGYRDPATYLPSLIEANGGVEGVPDLGFAAVIREQ